LGYEDDQLFFDYFELQRRLLNRGALPKVDITEQIKGIEEELLVNNQAQMTWAHTNQYFGFLQAAKRPLEIVPLPGPGQKKGLVVKPSMLFSISKSSKNKKAAAKFINFFVNNIEANKIIKGERGVPVSSKVENAVRKDLSPIQIKAFDYVKEVKNQNPTVEKADPLGGVEVVKLLQDISEQILFKKLTPREGATIFRTEANKILSKNK
jgi:multiple sugar transport system substrate-binding protein